MYLYLLTRDFKNGRGFESHTIDFFFMKEIFLNIIITLTRLFIIVLSYCKCFTIVFFECFFCVFCEFFFSSFFYTLFTYSFHYNTIQNNTKEFSTNILRLLILCWNSLSKYKITLLIAYLRRRLWVYRLFRNTHFRQLTFS